MMDLSCSQCANYKENTRKVIQYLSYRSGKEHTTKRDLLNQSKPLCKADALWHARKMQMDDFASIIDKRSIQALDLRYPKKMQKCHFPDVAMKRINPISNSLLLPKSSTGRAFAKVRSREKDHWGTTPTEEKNKFKNKEIRDEFEKLKNNLIMEHGKENPKCRKFVKNLKHAKKTEFQKNRIIRDCERKRERLDKINLLSVD